MSDNSCCESCGRPLDLQRCCKSCGATFSMSLAEQNWYHEKSWPLPLKCKDCRQARQIHRPRAIPPNSRKDVRIDHTTRAAPLEEQTCGRPDPARTRHEGEEDR